MADVKGEIPEPVLNQTAYVVLGMLSYGYSLSGYELRQWSIRSLGAFYKPPAQSQVYRELANLENAGLVASTPISQSDNPDKVVFTMTDAGRQRLEQWVAHGQPSALALKHPLAVQTSFANGVDPTELIERLDAHISSTMTLLHDLEDLHSGLHGDPGSSIARVTLEWAMEIRRGDLAGAELARSALASISVKP